MTSTYTALYHLWVTVELPDEYEEALQKGYELENENYHTEAGEYFDKADQIRDIIIDQLIKTTSNSLRELSNVTDYEFVEGWDD